MVVEVAFIDAEFGEAILNCPEIVGEPSRAARNLSSWASRCSGAASSDKGDPLRTIPSFAEDRQGELYVLSFDGRIYEFVEAGKTP